MDYHPQNCLEPLKIDLRHPMVSTRLLRKTMVHEMCHLWVYLEHRERGHGPLFWKKMAECGYPDGHQFPDAKPDEIDRYQLARKSSAHTRGDTVVFTLKSREEIRGVVLRVNRRTVSVQSGERRFRVSPALLRSAP